MGMNGLSQSQVNHESQSDLANFQAANQHGAMSSFQFQPVNNGAQPINAQQAVFNTVDNQMQQNMQHLQQHQNNQQAFQQQQQAQQHQMQLDQQQQPIQPLGQQVSGFAQGLFQQQTTARRPFAQVNGRNGVAQNFGQNVPAAAPLLSKRPAASVTFGNIAANNAVGNGAGQGFGIGPNSGGSSTRSRMSSSNFNGIQMMPLTPRKGAPKTVVQGQGTPRSATISSGRASLSGVSKAGRMF
ncbi:hypothetical protein BJ742DRAFT_242033 [Cladochytrium replicatum]|nr:hypothetical protein BJ742DRAFT_242033 [Cladochytrium replicatum]